MLGSIGCFLYISGYDCMIFLLEPACVIYYTNWFLNDEWVLRTQDTSHLVMYTTLFIDYKIWLANVLLKILATTFMTDIGLQLCLAFIYSFLSPLPALSAPALHLPPSPLPPFSSFSSFYNITLWKINLQEQNMYFGSIPPYLLGRNTLTQHEQNGTSSPRLFPRRLDHWSLFHNNWQVSKNA